MSQITFMIIGVVVTLSSIAHAVDADHAGNGGDTVGLEFQGAASIAMTLLNTDALSSAQWTALNAAFSKAHYFVVDTPLTVPVNTAPIAFQDSVAMNDSSTGNITISRKRWTGIESNLEKERIALHELLCLIGVESTGDYHVSSRLSKASITYNCSLSSNKGWATYSGSLVITPDHLAHTTRLAVVSDENTWDSGSSGDVIGWIAPSGAAIITIRLRFDGEFKSVKIYSVGTKSISTKEFTDPTGNQWRMSCNLGND